LVRLPFIGHPKFKSNLLSFFSLVVIGVVTLFRRFAQKRIESLAYVLCSQSQDVRQSADYSLMIQEISVIFLFDRVLIVVICAGIC